MVIVFCAICGTFSDGVNIPAFTVSSFAGTHVLANGGDGSKASSTTIGSPTDVWVNPAGELFLTDANYNIVRKVATDGIINSFAGSGRITLSGNGGKATSAGMIAYGICGDTANSFMYFVDGIANTVRRLEVSSNIIDAFAGSGSVINDNGPATNAKLSSSVTYCAVDTVGDVYLSDTGNNLIRKVTTGNGFITSVAGVAGLSTFVADGAPATSSPLNSPQQIYLDTTATLYIYVKTHYRVRKLDLTLTIDKSLVTVIGKMWFILC